MDQPTSRRISVVDPLSRALDRVNKVLFDPFDLGKWFILGFGAWLAMLGQIGFGGPTLNFFLGQDSQGRGGIELLVFTLPFTFVGMIVGLAMAVVFAWLGSRADFIFAHCVVRDKAEVSEPWKLYSRQGNSLFLVRLGIGVVWFLVTFLLFGLAIFQYVTLYSRGQRPMVSELLLYTGAFWGVHLLLSGIFMLFIMLLRDLVVPIMMLRGCTCSEAWYELKTLIGANFGRFTLYVVFRLLLATLIFLIIGALILCTCCLGLFLLGIPYIGSVVLLPASVFKRSYSLYYLAQYGPEYDVFGPDGGEGGEETPEGALPPQGPVEPETIVVGPREVVIEPGRQAPPRPPDENPWDRISPPEPPPYSG